MDIKKIVLPIVAAGTIVIAGTVAPVTERLVSFVQSFEGYSSVAYPDPAAPDNKALITTCSGITNLALPGFVQEGKVYTKQECDEAEAKILKQVSKEIAPLLKQDIPLEQYEMLIDFSYNVGIANFSNSTLLKKINLNDCHAAALEFDKWNKANKKVMKGLTRRRNAEEDRFDNWCLPDGTFPKIGANNVGQH